MAEDLDPLTTETPSMSHRGILLMMAVVVICGTVVGFAIEGARFGIGIAVGGVLAFANYFWLDRSTKAIFQPDAIRSTGILAMKYILRYVAIGAVLLAIYLTDVLPIVAVVAGLGAFALAIVIHGLKSIFTSSN